MTDLERWIAAFIAMDDRRKSENLGFMEDTAKTYPARPQPVLRLIIGGAK